VGAEREQKPDGTDSGPDGRLDSGREERVRLDIVSRIRSTCAHLSEQEFSQLVDEMTDRQLRGERRANREFWPD
jgi:hypothetical protein